MNRAAVDEIIAALEAADLRGRGGAGFPTARKLAAVASASARRRGRPVPMGRPSRPIVVVNACEGEPLSAKDSCLLRGCTEELIDGATRLGDALGAQRVIIAVDARRLNGHRTAVGARIARAGIELVGVPAGFISGQDTALVNALGGGPAIPTATPPFPAERGLDRAPTLVVNLETVLRVERIVSGRDDGRRYVTVSGAHARATVLAVAPTTTVGEALADAGADTRSVRAVLLGGYGGTWAPAPEALTLPLDESALRARGLTLGSGIVHALDARRCGVTQVARVTRWMAGQSAGQCGPCVHGLDAIAGALETLADPTSLTATAAESGHPANGAADSADGAAALAQLRRWTAMVTGRGGCAHPDGVARFVTSALSTFGPEFAAHARDGRCAHCADSTGQAARPSTHTTPSRRASAPTTPALAR